MYFMKYINNILNFNSNFNSKLNLGLNSNLDVSSSIKITSDIETGNFEIDENYDIEIGIYKNISNYISMLNDSTSNN